jgi:hypothetical protein
VRRAFGVIELRRCQPPVGARQTISTTINPPVYRTFDTPHFWSQKKDSTRRQECVSLEGPCLGLDWCFHTAPTVALGSPPFRFQPFPSPPARTLAWLDPNQTRSRSSQRREKEQSHTSISLPGAWDILPASSHPGLSQASPVRCPKPNIRGVEAYIDHTPPGSQARNFDYLPTHT